MKGITPIIAIVLLLMITVSMAGFALLWFQRIGSIAMNATESGIIAQQQAAGKLIRIDNAKNGTDSEITIRNIGTYPIKKKEISIYVDSGSGYTKKDCTPSWAGSDEEISPGGTATCTLSSTSCIKVKVTAPGNTDIASCG